MRLLRVFGRISPDCIILGVVLRTTDREVGKWDREGKEDSIGMLKSLLVGWGPGVKSDVGLLGDCVGHPMSCLPEQKGSQSICSTTPFPCCQGLTPRGSPSPGALSFGTWSLILGPEKPQACLSVRNCWCTYQGWNSKTIRTSPTASATKNSLLSTPWKFFPHREVSKWDVSYEGLGKYYLIL